MASVVPNVVHLIKTDPRPLTRFLFLNILSILHNLNPSTLYFHVTTPPHGFFWNLTRTYDSHRQIVVAEIKAESYRLAGQNEIPIFRSDWADAHSSDIIRMNILKSMGGIYLDTDVLVLRSFNDLMNFDLTMGLQTFTKMCNGVIIASPKSKFLEEWYSGLYNASFKTCWDCHSIELPSKIWAKQKKQHETLGNNTLQSQNVQVANILPLESFYDPSFSRSDLHELFRESVQSKSSTNNNVPAKQLRLVPPYTGKYAVHLWNRVNTASVYLRDHRFEMICVSMSMYNSMLRFALNGTLFLAKLCADTGMMKPEDTKKNELLTPHT